MKKHSTTILLFVVMFVGLGLLLYPSVADYVNSFTQSRAIARYTESVERDDGVDYSAYWQAAEAYNQGLVGVDIVSRLNNPYALGADYDHLLRAEGSDVMGVIEIPGIAVMLPVYHGTSNSVLSVAVGHLEGSSLPVGGESTHAVVSAHRGLPTAVLFTHLDRMEVGDTFYFTILDRTITYEVDQIRIVEPNDTSLIRLKEGKDYCTLLTCTPYGINTQRLLVRGHQVDETQTRNLYVANEAYRIEPLIVMPVVALPIIFVLLIYVMFAPVKKETLGEDTL